MVLFFQNNVLQFLAAPPTPLHQAMMHETSPEVRISCKVIFLALCHHKLNHLPPLENQHKYISGLLPSTQSNFWLRV
jgi:hypothetical protein